MKKWVCWIWPLLGLICIRSGSSDAQEDGMWQFGPLTTYPLRTVFQNPCQSLNPDVAIACDPANQQAGQYRYDQLPVIYLMVPSSAPSTAAPVEATPSIDRLIQPDPSYYQTSPVDHSYLSRAVPDADYVPSQYV